MCSLSFAYHSISGAKQTKGSPSYIYEFKVFAKKENVFNKVVKLNASNTMHI